MHAASGVVGSLAPAERSRLGEGEDGIFGRTVPCKRPKYTRGDRQRRSTVYQAQSHPTVPLVGACLGVKCIAWLGYRLPPSRVCPASGFVRWRETRSANLPSPACCVDSICIAHILRPCWHRVFPLALAGGKYTAQLHLLMWHAPCRRPGF